ncbi:hypothetical protein ACIQXI_09140 [Lysinibacillus sp. NPDC097195]|uniref:hypothetical protein n=1 Tax=Lysinibacillus sp. NPDC097195 TaxID=3364141 RepID=UPI0037FDFE0A
MNSNSSESRKIVVRITPEMANWMHPQTEERKQQIQKRVEASKKRYSQRKKLEEESDNSILREYK